MARTVSVLTLAFVFSAIPDCLFAEPSQNGASVYDRLSQVFEPDIEGTTIAYLENILGPAKKVHKWGGRTVRTYRVGPCEVTVKGEDSVSSIQLERLSPRCSFDFQSIASVYSGGTGAINAFGMTFEDIEKALGYVTYKFADRCGMMDCGLSVPNPQIGFEFEAGFPGMMLVFPLTAWLTLGEDKPDKAGNMMYERHFKFNEYLTGKYGEDKVRVEWAVDPTPEDSEKAWEAYK
jgi:hypothetical protein